MQPILFLMFEGKAEEALNFYVSLIPNIRMIRIERYAASGPGAEGSVMRELFSIGGMNIMCTDSAIHHQFTFASAASLFLPCSSEEETDRLASALGSGGQVLMPLDKHYGISRRFTWLKDRF